MTKEEILEKAQKENNGVDVADLNAQKKAAYYSYFIGVIGIIIVNIINGIILNNVNHGANFVIFLMLSIAFTIKHINLKKKHELIVSICYYCITILFLVLWILQLFKVF